MYKLIFWNNSLSLVVVSFLQCTQGVLCNVAAVFMLVLFEYSYGRLNGILLLFVCCSSRNMCLQRSEKSSKPQVVRSPVVNCRFLGHTRTVAVLQVHSSEPSIQHYANFLHSLVLRFSQLAYDL